MCWSRDGKLLATFGKDHSIRVYDPRKSTAPIKVSTWARSATPTLRCVARKEPVPRAVKVLGLSG